MAQDTSTKRTQNTKIIVGVAAFVIIIAVGAVLFGRADKGQIDVSATIVNSNNEKIERGEGEALQTVPRGISDEPNGGLIGTGKPPKQEVPQPSVEGVGTSTDETELPAEGEGGTEDAQTEPTSGELDSEAGTDAGTTEEGI